MLILLICLSSLENLESKNVSAILKASSGPITLAPIHNTLALLCSLVACAEKQSLHNAALIPLILLAAMLIPIPVPQRETQDAIGKIAKEILHRRETNTDYSELEEQINRLVAVLYQ